MAMSQRFTTAEKVIYKIQELPVGKKKHSGAGVAFLLEPCALNRKVAGSISNRLGIMWARKVMIHRSHMPITAGVPGT